MSLEFNPTPEALGNNEQRKPQPLWDFLETFKRTSAFPRKASEIQARLSQARSQEEVKSLVDELRRITWFDDRQYEAFLGFSPKDPAEEETAPQDPQVEGEQDLSFSTPSPTEPPQPEPSEPVEGQEEYDHLAQFARSSDVNRGETRTEYETPPLNQFASENEAPQEKVERKKGVLRTMMGNWSRAMQEKRKVVFSKRKEKSIGELLREPAPEEIEIQNELEKAPREEREKIAKNLFTVGFVFDRWKNDGLAKTFEEVANSNLEQNSFVTNWCRKLNRHFRSEADKSEKKAKDVVEGKADTLTKIHSPAILAGRVLQYGRTINDWTTNSLVSPLRYVMTLGKVVDVGAGTAKDARLESDKVRSGTWFGKVDMQLDDNQYADDIARAQEEAIKIYEKAGGKYGVDKIPARDLKDAYLREMPENLKKRLQNTRVAAGFWQKIVKWDVAETVSRLNKSVAKIENNKKLTPEQKEEAKLKLLRREEININEWDRMISNYGTVDGLSMLARYAQTAGKTAVAVVTLETLLVSVPKLFENMSNLLSRSEIGEALLGGSEAKMSAVTETKADLPISEPPAGPSVDEIREQIMQQFENKDVTFGPNKGGIAGIVELKTQMRELYPDISKAPESVQKLLSSNNATGQALRWGFFKPDGTSLIIREGSTLKFDKLYNLVFHDAKTGKNIILITDKGEYKNIL